MCNCHNDWQIELEIVLKCHNLEWLLAYSSWAEGESAGDGFDVIPAEFDGEPDAIDVLFGEELLDEAMPSLEAAIAIAGGLLIIDDGNNFESIFWVMACMDLHLFTSCEVPDTTICSVLLTNPKERPFETGLRPVLL